MAGIGREKLAATNTSRDTVSLEATDLGPTVFPMASASSSRTPSSPLADFLQSAAFPGVLLIACTIVAIAAANSPFAEQWHHLWHADFAITLGGATVSKSVSHWINDGLMVVFFFAVGLEIKHEVLDGQLRSVKRAALPVAAALGGMIVPATIYALVIRGEHAEEAAAGWGIPMATDIAFALGVLAVLGKRVPIGLKVFLASLAIADDLGAVLVIAIFYTAEISWSYLALGGGILVLSWLTNRAGVRHTWPYVVYGIALWITFLQSGVHATIAGVGLAFTIPARRRLDEKEFVVRGQHLLAEFDRVGDPDPLTNEAQMHIVQELQRHATDVQAPLQRMVHGLHPFVQHFVIPVFALANAGVALSGSSDVLHHPAAHGVFLGLLLGKPIGVMGATWLAAKLLGSALPDGVTWRHVHGAAWLAGIGFTMALFVDGLAFANAPAAFEASKVAIIAASALAGTIGFVLLRRLPPV